MALTIKHNFQTAKSDDPAKDVSASEWNDAHGVTGVLDVANGGTGVTTGAVLKTGDTMSGSLSALNVTAAYSASAGSYYFGNSGTKYLTYNGTQFQLVGGDLQVINSDIKTWRSDGTGVIYLGNAGAYLYWNGSAYSMPTWGLNVVSLGTGALTANGHVQTTSSVYLNSSGTYASDPTQIRIYGANAYPTITFHSEGYFGANFGMSTNGNFYMGGWSFGVGYAYQFWTTRDFGANPVNCLINTRLAFLADDQCFDNAGMVEPYGGGVVTGLSNNQTGYGYISARFRQLQIQTGTGAWYAVGYA